MDTMIMTSNVVETKVECDYCQATFKLTFVKHAGGVNDIEPYHCPECNKQYYVRAFSPISKNNIFLLSNRNDGRTSLFVNPLDN